jgi:hypothetical protein
MADYHMQYSFQIERLTPDEVEWFKAYFTRIEEAAEESDEYVSLGESWFEDGGELGTVLWFHGYEGFSDEISDMFQAFLKEHRPDGYIAFEWANTCTKDRLDAFSGGACFVTAEKVEWNGTSNFIAEKTKEFKNEAV